MEEWTSCFSYEIPVSFEKKGWNHLESRVCIPSPLYSYSYVVEPSASCQDVQKETLEGVERGSDSRWKEGLNSHGGIWWKERGKRGCFAPNGSLHLLLCMEMLRGYVGTNEGDTTQRETRMGELFFFRRVSPNFRSIFSANHPRKTRMKLEGGDTIFLSVSKVKWRWCDDRAGEWQTLLSSLWKQSRGLVWMTSINRRGL